MSIQADFEGILTEPVNGAELLEDVHAFLGRYVSYPSEEAHTAHTLWIAHAWLMEAWDSTPRIAFLSPEPGSGKTMALLCTELLTPTAILVANATSAYLFRRIGAQGNPPTILYDEIDTVFGARQKESAEEIRAMLNAGHRRGAVVGRAVVAGNGQVGFEELPVYAAVALAGLGDLPDTLMSRSVIVRMRKQAPNDKPLEDWRVRDSEAQAEPIAHALDEWSASVVDEAREGRPEIPNGVRGRDADVWEPLIVVADLAGGRWPDAARSAAVSLTEVRQEQSRMSVGVRLLSDIREVWGNDDFIKTSQLLYRLTSIAEANWSDFAYGKPLNAEKLSSLLRGYNIQPLQVKVDGKNVRGYYRAEFEDAWNRYLPSVPGSEASVPGSNVKPGTGKTAELRGSVPGVPGVPGFPGKGQAGEGWMPDDIDGFLAGTS